MFNKVIGQIPQEVLAASVAGLAIILGLLVLKSSRSSNKYKLPPQVPGVPLFGNALQIPALQQGPWAKKLAEKYGEMLVCFV